MKPLISEAGQLGVPAGVLKVSVAEDPKNHLNVRHRENLSELVGGQITDNCSGGTNRDRSFFQMYAQLLGEPKFCAFLFDIGFLDEASRELQSAAVFFAASPNLQCWLEAGNLCIPPIKLTDGIHSSDVVYSGTATP